MSDQPTDVVLSGHAQSKRDPRIIVHRGDLGGLIAIISIGGALGAVARYGLTVAWPTPATGFPTATLVINVSGSALIGALMVLMNDVWIRQRLLRPFLEN